MLLIEKAVRLLDDRHYAVYREYVRTLSKRSYYPLVLVDVIKRDSLEKIPTDRLFFEVYGEEAQDEKDHQKLFQLGHYTFRLTAYLSRNYPNYLGWNVSRIQQLINEGQLDQAIQIAEMLVEVANKIEDFATLRAVLGILAQNEIHQQSFRRGVEYYQRIETVLDCQRDLNRLNLICYQQAFDNSSKLTTAELDDRLGHLAPFFESKSTGVRLFARLEYFHLLHVGRDPRFFAEGTEEELRELREDLQRNEYVVLPFLQNLRSKLDFLFLRHSMRTGERDSMIAAAEKLSVDAELELFWNSYVNLPELSSIAVQTSFLVSNYFYSYRPDANEMVPAEVREKVRFLSDRCEKILDNPMLREHFVIPYINLSTVYSGLLLLGDMTTLKKSVNTLEYLLMSFQQVAFHAYLDPIFVTLIMAQFSLEDYAGLERSYRRYKKTSKGKNVNFENDLILHAYYFIAKYRETGRAGYAKKLDKLLAEADARPGLAPVMSQIGEVANFFGVNAKQ